MIRDICSELGAILNGMTTADAKLFMLGDTFYDTMSRQILPVGADAASAAHAGPFARALCVQTFACAVSYVLVVLRRPSGRVSKCSCASGARKAEEGHSNHQ